jgi:hypothetical protein
MYLADDGIYRINKSDFETAGITTSGIDPRTVKVYYKGSQIPIFFNGEQDGVFNDTDYFDFYGTRNYGGLTPYYNINYQVQYINNEYYDLYSDTSTYWIGWGGSYGIRMTDFVFNSSVPYPNSYFMCKVHFEKELVYSMGENVSLTDYRFFMNDRFQGESWYWKLMLFQNTITDTFSTYFKFPNTMNCLLRVFAYPVNLDVNSTFEHKLIIKINNNTLADTIKANHITKIDTTVAFSSSLLNQGSNNLLIRYAPPSSFSEGQLYFDLAEITYPRRFEFENNLISFQDSGSDTTSKIFKIKGYNSANPVFVYDVKYGYRIVNKYISNDTVSFSGKGDGKFQIINKNITKKPFRIKQKQVPNLVSTANGVDYLIIYNKLFETQAEQLRQHRASFNSFRSVKSEIEDIYDIFNYGIESPVAVRNFTQYVYNNWQSPKMKYICLLGRGSTDPKNYLTTSIYSKNYIPIFGYPPTDGYYANMIPGSFTYYDNAAIGRLPAFTVQEAQDMVNKIMNYDLNPVLDSWVKKFIMISGGYDRNEQQLFITQTNTLLNNNVLFPPTSGYPVKIYLNDSSGFLTYNFKDSIINSINRGGAIINYIGHAGNLYWDYNFENANVLSNGNLLPLVFSMTCFTGRNSEADARGYGETFLINYGKGAIGFVGTTGWSFSGSGYDFNGYLYRAYSQDSLRATGDILRKAMLYMLPDTNNFPSRNTINCFNLIGDPASKVLMPNYPEFDINSSDYRISNPNPALSELVNLTVYPKNLGTFADSCKIRFLLLKNGSQNKSTDIVVHNWTFIDTINYSFTLDSLGNYIMKVILDIENWYPQEITSNNILSIPITMKNRAFVPLKPLDNVVIKSDSVEIVGLNPDINCISNNVRLIMQIDTSRNFNSAFLQTYYRTGFSGVVTKFKIPVPVLDSNIIYYWRLNSVVNSTDTAGWSAFNRFYVNFNYTKNNEKSKEFSSAKNINLADSVFTISKKSPGQYVGNLFENVTTIVNSIILGYYPAYMYIRSQTIFAWAPSYVTISTSTIPFANDASTGLNLIKVKKLTLSIVDRKNFKMLFSESSDSVINYLNTFDQTHYLVACKVFNVPNAISLTQAAINKIRQFGSTYVDSIGNFNWWSTWAFLGYLNATPQNAYESFVYYPGGGIDPLPAVISITPQFQYTSGKLTQQIGPAEDWRYFAWAQNLYANSSIKFDVYGLTRNNNPVLLYQDLTSNNFVSIDTLNPYYFPNLKMVTKLNIDTISGLQSPEFKSFRITYQPPAEIVIDSIACNLPDTVRYGDGITVKANYYNVGYSKLYGYIRSWYSLNDIGMRINIKTDTVNSVLDIDQMGTSTERITLTYFNVNSAKRLFNTYNLYFEVTPLGQQNDFYYFNNSAVLSFLIKNSPLMKDKFELFADGIRLIGGEYVKPKPEMSVKTKDLHLNFYDSSEFKVYINNSYLPLKNENQPPDNKYSKTRDNQREITALKFFPKLSDGENNIKFIIKFPESGYTDTLKYSVLVSSELSMKNVNNFPNPMKNETYFIFNLTGINAPPNCKIKIFSASGRLIKLINTSVNIGLNNIHWDGKDNDGDVIANGVYFYKIILEGDTKKETPVQKLVVLK